MRRALTLAASVPARLVSPNPRVGAVVLDPDGAVAGEGFHVGPGQPHAEVVALERAGTAAAGGTLVCTLEPCHHHGRTPPCDVAIAEAGITTVVYAQPDPNPVAGGGTRFLRGAGIAVRPGVEEAAAVALNRSWTFAIRHQRPRVTWKFAATLDGRTAAVDGSSQWITGPAARTDVQRLRAEAGAIVVGTGTVLADDPRLTLRDPDGSPLERSRQPLRVVAGSRALPEGLRIFDDAAPTVRTHGAAPGELLAQLFARDVHQVLLEGGATLAAGFLRARVVDEVVAYLVPALLGGGPAAVGDLGIDTIADARRFDTERVDVFDGDVRVVLRPTRGGD